MKTSEADIVARDKLLEILEHHKCYDEKEYSDLKQMKVLIRKHPDIFHRSCETAHLAGSAIVVDVNKGKILLHRHKSLGLLLQFGGHPEGENDISLVALRETQEETGLPDLSFYPNEKNPLPIDVDVHTIPSSKGVPEHLHLDVRYILSTRQSDKICVDKNESDYFLWLSYGEAVKMKDRILPSLMRLIEKTFFVF